MSNWLGIALAAYVIGAAIEGMNAASQLSHPSSNLSDRVEPNISDATDPPEGKWRVYMAIAAVSLCGAILWPCRLMHRSLKATQPCRDD